jgi:hypothetical protein
VVGRDTGAGHDEVDALDRGFDLRRRRRREDRRARRGRVACSCRVGVTMGLVFDHGDVVAREKGVGNDGFARGAETDDEHVHQSIAPGMLMKSA